MRRHVPDRRPESALATAGVAVLLAGLALHPVEGVAQERDDRPRPGPSYEVRVQIFAPSIRRSRIDTESRFSDDANQGLYFSPGLEVRLVATRGHAVLVDGEYRFQLDPMVSTDGKDPVSLRFGVAHVGYAYRHVAHGPRETRRRRRWAISPHVALATGGAQARDDYPDSGIPRRTPVIGTRAGLDLDVHVGRVFLGWRFSYELLHHTRGSITRSSFFTWNILPLFRIGVNLGRPIASR